MANAIGNPICPIETTGPPREKYQESEPQTDLLDAHQQPQRAERENHGGERRGLQ
jgi:hypothetical protein